MKTNNKTNKATTNQVINAAKSDIKNISPFFYINSLTKLAKKNEFCEHKNVKMVCDKINDIAKAKGVAGRYGFCADLLTKDSRGRFCYSLPRKLHTFALMGQFFTSEELDNAPIFDYDTDAVDVRFDTKGRDVVKTENGYGVLQPIPFTLLGFLGAFAEIVKINEQQIAAAAKSAAKREREQLKAAKAIVAAYNHGVISEYEMHVKLSEMA